MNRSTAARALSSTFLIFAVQLAGCPSDDAPTGGAGGTTGTPSGTGALPTSGSVATTAGTSGAAASTGLSCATADKGAPSALHSAALDALIPKSADNLGPCAFSSCHLTSVKKAKLALDFGTTDLNALLVDKASCESPNLKLVDTSGGDSGLARSWLWQKLTAPADSSGKLDTKAEWGTAATGCNQDSGMGFGLRMPLSGGADQLADTKLKAIRNWICAGAPKP